MPKVDVRLCAAFEFLWHPARYKIALGGRGGAKSWAYARALLLQALQRKLRVLCARELQLSIADSVHKLLKEQIDAMGLSAYYSITNQAIRSATGSEFLFTGIKSNVSKVKSMEGIDICWVEEAEKVSEASWQVLIPTIRKEGSEIWVTFNPMDEADATYQRFVVNPPPGAVVREVSWRDNHWFPATLVAEKDYLYRVDPEAADHVWGGKTRKISNANVLRGRYVVEPFFVGKFWDGPYQGVDWGFANDPTTLVRCWIHERTLYVEHEAYGVGVELDATPALFDTVPDARKFATRADSARPETIRHVQTKGYDKVVAAAKGAGSVEDGVEYLRSFERIVIHPRCTHTAEEARLWSYKTNNAGDVLPMLVDKHNHCWDAIRYALEPLIKSGNDGMIEYMRQEAEKATRQP